MEWSTSSPARTIHDSYDAQLFMEWSSTSPARGINDPTDSSLIEWTTFHENGSNVRMIHHSTPLRFRPRPTESPNMSRISQVSSQIYDGEL